MGITKNSRCPWVESSCWQRSTNFSQT